jgi:hypothetical protein
MSEALTGDELLSLLPSLYRLRDADTGGVLAELMNVLARELQVLSAELDQFYDDQFIETCADWVAPYIGDLIGYRPMYGVVPAVSSPRADVANTIRNRRRKGTALMFEQLARDVTGWPAREVEFFQRVIWAQYMNHIRPGAAATPDLRQHEAVGFIATAFDDLAHTVDVRHITTGAHFHPTPDSVGGPGAARHNIKNVGIFLWRIAAIPLLAVPATTVDTDPRRFRIDPLGRDLPLFAADRPVTTITPIRVDNVPAPLRRRVFDDHKGQYYGPDASLLLEIFDGTTSTPVSPDDLLVCDLSDVAGGWAHEPPAGKLAVDPALGRIYRGDPLPADSTLLVSWHYGEAVPCGACGRDRGADPQPDASVARGAPLQPALDSVAGTGGIVLVDDSWTYTGTPTLTAPAPAAGEEPAPVTLRARDLQRPVLNTAGPLHLDIGTGGAVVLDGLMIAGGPVVLDEHADTDPRTLTLQDCTLVPGLRRSPDGSPLDPDAASLIVLHPFASVTLKRCIVGPIIGVEGTQLKLIDCIVDAGDRTKIAYTGRAAHTDGSLRTVTSAVDAQVGDGMTPGGSLTLSESTVIGGVHAETLSASNCLLLADLATGTPWPAPVWAHRRQAGCIRFSWLPMASRTGPRFHCRPDTTPPEVPTLTSTRFGDPGYCQIDVVTPDAIRRGADDESEMGVTHGLFTPQREANLRIRLTEYLRFGLEAGFSYAT